MNVYLPAHRSCPSVSNAMTSNPRCTQFARKPVLRFTTRRQIRALELGADEIYLLLEWGLRSRSRSLRAARRRYQKFCTDALSRLERITRTGARSCQAA
jgi:hypothetical protein